MNVWIESARPKTLIASVAPIVLGTCIALRESNLNPTTLIMTLLVGLLLQIGTNFANEYFDGIKGADTDQRVGPQRGIIPREQMKLAMIATFVLMAISSLALVIKGGILISLLVAIAIALGILYTAGPFALAYLGISDFFVLFGFGSIATFTTTYLQTDLFDTTAFIAGLAPGALSVAILTANNLRDELSDRLAKKQTPVVRFGQLFGKIEYIFFLLLAAAIPPILVVFFDYPETIIAASVIPLPLIIPSIQAKTAHDFVPLLPKTAFVLLIYTVIFSYGLLV